MSEFTEKTRGRWHGILSALGVDEKCLTGRHTACPICNAGRDRFRFDDKEGRGTWICNVCGSGDGAKLLMDVHGWDFLETARRVEAVIGDIKPSFKSKPSRDRRPLLRRISEESCPVSRGDIVDRYLRGRGVAHVDMLRTHAHMAYYRDGVCVGRYPAMIAMVSDADGKPATYHVTYLDPTARKANLNPAKKLMPPVRRITGGAVRLFGAEECLGIAEGIETALAASALFGMPVWSAISAHGLETFIPPRVVKRLTIFADNDASFTGQKAAYALAHRCVVKLGIEAEVMIPPVVGNDWADVVTSDVAA